VHVSKGEGRRTQQHHPGAEAYLLQLWCEGRAGSGTPTGAGEAVQAHLLLSPCFGCQQIY